MRAGGKAGRRTDRRVDARQRKRDRDKLLKAKGFGIQAPGSGQQIREAERRAMVRKKNRQTKQTQMEPSHVHPPSPTTHPES